MILRGEMIRAKQASKAQRFNSGAQQVSYLLILGCHGLKLFSTYEKAPKKGLFHLRAAVSGAGSAQLVAGAGFEPTTFGL